MRIASSISLAGPLSRNRALSNLKAGDTVRVSILKLQKENSALINLLGNKVVAHFEETVPKSSTIQLVILGNRNGKLLFKLKQNDHQPQLPSQLLLRSAGDINLFLRSVSQPITDLFQLNNILLRYRTKKNAPDKKKIFAKLKNLGFSNTELDELSRKVLSKMPRMVQALISSLLPQNGDEDKKRSTLYDKISNLGAEDAQLLMMLFEESSMTLFLNIDRSNKYFNVLFDSNSLCISFELENSGLIQVVAHEGELTIDLSLYFEKHSFLTAFSQDSEKLKLLLQASHKEVNFYCYDLKTAINTINSEIERLKSKPIFDFKV